MRVVMTLLAIASLGVGAFSESLAPNVAAVFTAAGLSLAFVLALNKRGHG